MLETPKMQVYLDISLSKHTFAKSLLQISPAVVTAVR